MQLREAVFEACKQAGINSIRYQGLVSRGNAEMARVELTYTMPQFHNFRSRLPGDVRVKLVEHHERYSRGGEGRQFDGVLVISHADLADESFE